MTSSYNISRRSEKELYSPTNFGAFQKNFGVCPPSYGTVPITHNGRIDTDWKFCVPPPEPTFSLQSSVCQGGIKARYNTRNLYDNPNVDNLEGSRTYMNPSGARSKQTFDRDKLDYLDYFRLPVKFDGTGFYPTRAKGDKFLMDKFTARGAKFVGLDPHHLVQRAWYDKQYETYGTDLRNI